MPAYNSDAILQLVVARTIGTRDTIRVNEVLASNVPRGVKAYLHAEVARRLTGEFERAEHFVRLGGSAVEAVHLRSLYIRHAADAYLLHRSEYATLIDNAVRFTENYICRPRATIRSFLFQDSPTLLATTLLSRLESMTEYIYLPRLLSRLITDRKIEEISDTACSELIAQIDDAVVRRHSPRELARLTAPIFSFYLLTNDPGAERIPIRPILVFYEDKGMTALRDHLEGVMHLRDRTEVLLSELEDFVEDHLTPKREPLPPEPPAALPEPPVESPPPPGEESLPPLEESFQEIPPEEEEPPHAEEPNDQQESQKPPPVPDGEPGGLPAPPEEPVIAARTTLQSLISEDQRRRFINALCDRDEVFYELIIVRLNEIPTWSEASAYIRELFEINSIDPFHQLAVTFTDIVQRRFSANGAPTP